MRVLEFRGMGPIIILTSLYTPIVLAYFGCLLISRNRHVDWFLFLIVFIGMIFINLLSGGRGTVLAPVLSMIIIYHFIRKNIKISFILTAAIVLLSSAAILEVLRNQVSVDDNQVQVFSEEGSSRASF